MLRDSTRESVGESVFDGSYEIIAPVGRGRNSVVYRARRLPGVLPKYTGGEFIALKVLVGNSKNPLIHLRRMKREALAMLSCLHENVVKLNDYITNGQLCYLAMEFAERGDLKRILDQQNLPFTPPLVLRLMTQVLSGLEKIHRVGILHRDIKPENLLLTESYEIKIADFGIACLPSEEVPLEEANRGIGTFDYLAPESLEEGISNEATDVYSCAVTLYQLLTGHLPFGGISFTEQIENKLGSRLIPLKNFMGDVPPLLEEFVNSALRSSPDERYRTAAEFREALEQFQKGSWEPDTEVQPLFACVGEKAQSSADETPADSRGKDKSQACHGPEVAVDSLVTELESPVGVSQGPGQVGEDVIRAAKWSERKAQWRSFLAGVRWFLTPKRVALVSIAVVLLLVFTNKGVIDSAKGLGAILEGFVGGSSGSEQKTVFVGKQKAPPGEAEVFSQGRAFSVLADGEHAGLLYGLLSDESDVSLVTAPGVGNREVVVVLALSGWEPVVFDAEKIRSERELQLLGSGIRLSLSVEHKDGSEGSKLSGTYKEFVSGREGRWAIW